MEDAIARIQAMEQVFDAVSQAVDTLSDFPERYGHVLPQLRVLSDYYTGGRWQADYAADEAGLLPRDLKRGVLSQDAVYDLLSQYDALLKTLNNGRNNEMKKFDAMNVKNQCVAWIRKFFEENGPGCNAVLGISGGKDSSVAAALCVEALGRDRVVGVLMPCGVQHDIDMAQLLVSHLGIRSYTVNIEAAVRGLENAMEGLELSAQSRTNLPPRIRMAAVYAVSQSVNGRVCNTCNLSEDWVGYSTRYGDAAGDFSPMSHLTVAEVKEIGRVLGLPDVLVDKVPIDGLCGKTDEDNLGFTYAVLDRYIREGVCEDEAVKARIDRLHRINQFKLELMPSFRPE